MDNALRSEGEPERRRALSRVHPCAKLPEKRLSESVVHFGLQSVSLKKHGLEVVNLPGKFVLRAHKHFKQNPKLSLKDCFALVLAEQISDSILLTGDANLRHTASDVRTEVHGVLWIIDEMRNHKIVNISILYRALSIFKSDEMVFLPEKEIEMRLRSLKREL